MNRDKHPHHPENADKTPRPLSSVHAQTGERRRPDEPVLERPDPDTETVDKVITPTSIKEKDDQAREINERVADNQRKLKD